MIMSIELFFGVILKTHFQSVVLPFCRSKMKRILKRLFWLKLLNLGFNKINSPQSNPILHTWEQKTKPTPNPKTQPHQQNYPIYFLWRACKQTSIIFVLEQLQVKWVINMLWTEADLKNLFSLPKQKNNQARQHFILTWLNLFYFTVCFCIFLKYLNKLLPK